MRAGPLPLLSADNFASHACFKSFFFIIISPFTLSSPTRLNRSYAVPFTADAVLAIDPEFETTSLLFAGELPCLGMHGKWSGGVLAQDGCLYCIPYVSARGGRARAFYKYW